MECFPGENLREVALREGIELYGLKGRLGNCGGCGQCITCFVEVVEGSPEGALSERTAVEERRIGRRPRTWRLACQSLVRGSLVVLTRPQAGFDHRQERVAWALASPLPAGPTECPQPPGLEAGDMEADECSGEGDGDVPGPSTTSDEAGPEAPGPR